jgi:hypothetical protein
MAVNFAKLPELLKQLSPACRRCQTAFKQSDAPLLCWKRGASNTAQ